VPLRARRLRVRAAGARVALLGAGEGELLLAVHLRLPAPRERRHARLRGSEGAHLRGHEQRDDRLGVLERARRRPEERRWWWRRGGAPRPVPRDARTAGTPRAEGPHAGTARAGWLGALAPSQAQPWPRARRMASLLATLFRISCGSGESRD